GLWGAIHKRLWEVGKNDDDLDRAIRAYARGYFMKNDYYNAINFAFMLNVRAATEQGDDAITDRVQAKRIRGEVLALCDAALAAPSTVDDPFWAKATKVEALVGLGRTAEADALKQEMLNANPKPEQWMIDRMEDQFSNTDATKPR